MSSYCTQDEAKSAGATGSTAEIAAAIVEASARVESYCSEYFEPTSLTLQLVVDSDGLARPHKRIQSVTSVSWLGVASPVASSGYIVSSSETGGRDTIAMYGDLSWADMTVLGAEPWNGGWANLSRSAEPTIVVVGTFGWTAPPPAVSHATAIIAARIRSGDVDPEVADTRADEEGNVLPVVPDHDRGDTAPAVRLRSRSTGSMAADELLARYVREPVRIRA